MHAQKLRLLFLLGGLLLSMGCFFGAQPTATPPSTLPPTQLLPTPTMIRPTPTLDDNFENGDFSVTAPPGWVIRVGPSATGKNAWNYYALDLNIEVEITNNKGRPYFTIASRDIPPGSTLEKEFTKTYHLIENQINKSEIDSRVVDGQTAMVIRYNRPWGEPWLHFEDTWVEKNGKILAILCQTDLDPTEEELKPYYEVLANFRLK